MQKPNTNATSFPFWVNKAQKAFDDVTFVFQGQKASSTFKGAFSAGFDTYDFHLIKTGVVENIYKTPV